MKLLYNVKNRMKNHTAITVSVLLLMLMFITSCEEAEDQSKYNPPADHTVSEDGVLHKSGLHDPLTNCVSCHGSDLQRGTVGVSCYECHGKKW